MSSTSETLRQELEPLEARRREISGEVEQARAELEEKRESLADGNGVSAAEVASAQSTFAALSEAQAVLDARIAAKNAEIEEAETHAARAAQLDQLFEIADEAQRFFERYSKAKSKALAVLEEAASEMVTSLDRMIAARIEFTRIAGGMVLKIHDSSHYNLTDGERVSRQRLLDELRERGVNLTAISIPWQGTVPTVLDAQSGTAFLGVPYVDFSGDEQLKGHAIGEAISLALDIARRKSQPATSVHVASGSAIVPEAQMVRW